MTEDTGDLMSRRGALMAEARTLLATVDDYTRRVAAYDQDLNETFEPWGGLEGGAFYYFNGPFAALIALGDARANTPAAAAMASRGSSGSTSRNVIYGPPDPERTQGPGTRRGPYLCAGVRWTEPRTPSQRKQRGVVGYPPTGPDNGQHAQR